MLENESKVLYQDIINSLSGGIVPRSGLAHIAVGREKELDSLLRDLSIIKDGGAVFRFIVGEYGSGKTFLLQTIKEYAVKNGFIVAEADLSPDRGLIGNTTKKRGLATYRELMSNVADEINQKGRALRKILELWVNKMFEKAALEINDKKLTVANMEDYTESLIARDCSVLQDMTYGFEFSQAVKLFWKASRNSDINEKQERQEAVIRWFRGDYRTNQEAKKAVGINATVMDENWFDYIMLWSVFFSSAGYKGMLILIDELINIYKASSNTARQQNYEKMLTMYNAALQGKANHLGIIVGSIPMGIYDKKRGVFSYEAMRSRLSTGVYQNLGLSQSIAPIIKVLPLSKEEMFVLLEKLSDIHAGLYDYTKLITEDEILEFVKLAYLKRETSFITPRTMIRDFIQVLDVKLQNPSNSIKDILSAYKFAVDEEDTYEDYND